MAKTVARSQGPRNRAIRDEDQPDVSADPTEQEAREAEIRRWARTGLTYGEVAEKFGLSLEELQTIIQPDLVQYVKSDTQEVTDRRQA